MICDEDGQFLAFGDLVYRATKVVIEYDGLVHLDEKQRRYDADRRSVLRTHGWLVVEINANDLSRPHRLIAKVRDALSLRERAA